ncbi:MAG: cyclase family protein [Gammaproteobacteria bacterium]|nr:cyclase family protein [Gammaproteobacteria bacterium]
MRGRKFWRKISGAALIALAGSGQAALAQTPAGPEWWPSEWGPEDERGAANRITPQKVLEAVSLIEEGRIYELGREYEPSMPLFGNRHFSLTIPGLPTVETGGENGVVFNDELVSGELGQIGTQFDGLGHVGTAMDGDYVFYNGFRLSEFGTSYGLNRLGIEKVGVLFTRGVLVDVARYKGVERLDPSYVITIEDIEATLDMEGVEIGEGDAVFFHTGWGQLWNVDNEAYGASEPGPGITAIKWLADKNIVMTAADNFAMEASPGENPRRPLEGHQWLLSRGIYNLENVDLGELAADRVYEFAFIFAPMKLKGATGAPGNPIAVR